MIHIFQSYKQNTGRKIPKEFGGRIIAVPFIFMALSILFCARTFAQPPIVKGK